MGPTIANAILVGTALRAGIAAPCHRRMFSTGSCPSRPHAEYSRRPSASGIAARSHTNARLTPPVHQSTSTSASCQASPSVPSFVRHARSFLRPAAQPLCPHLSALPYSTAPAAVAADPVPSSGGSCLRLPSSHPPLPCWPFSTLAVSPPLLASPGPLAFPLLLAFPTPVLDHLLPLPTPPVFPSCSPPCLSSVRPPCTLSVPGAHVLMRMCNAVRLLPHPTPRPRTSPPAAKAPAASAPWAFSSAPWDSPGSPPGAPLPAPSSTGPPPSQAPFPLASPPCRPGR